MRGSETSTNDGDTELTDKFQRMFDSCLLLNDVASSDEAAFAQWGKDKLKVIQDVRGQMYSKKKSLKRRSSQMSDDLGDLLEDLMNKLSQVSDLVKKISAGCPEGRHVYEGLSKLCDEIDVTASPPVWMRALRAMAFDNLKTKNWKEFFNDTWALCLQHLSGSSSDSSFFCLLSSQLLQRLIKAVPTSKGVTQESLAVVKSFADVMTETSHVVKTLPSGMSHEHHARMLNAQ
ncbi:secG, partial [Symbiodinium sp. KB8]